jgi:hypothetical protein
MVIALLASAGPGPHVTLVKQVRRVSKNAFRALPLRVHTELHGVPLRDVTVTELVGGGPDRTVAEVRELLASSSRGPAVRTLLALRRALGKLFGWDERAPSSGGPFQTRYELDREALLEVRNATVHAFLALALEPTALGYRLYWAVYVRPVSWLTPLYMTLIEPFRRFVVYPSLLGGVARAWADRFASAR